jgi:hypothetical protein
VALAAPAVTSSRVQELQRALSAHGYDPGAVDGSLGPATQAAIRKLQHDFHFDSKREIDDEVIASLTAMLTESDAPLRPRSKQAATTPAEPASVDAWEQGLSGSLQDSVSSYAIVAEVLDVSGLAAPPDAAKKPVAEWARSVYPLFDTAQATPTPRWLALGLVLLDGALADAVEVARAGGISDAAEALGLPISDILTEEGRKRWRIVATVDGTGTLLDRPAAKDELGRLDFARELVLRLREVRNAYYEPDGTAWPESLGGPFMIHLHGAWGSGKSSLLGFVAEELREPKMRGPDERRAVPWVVVEFNAWQHQRIAPPWWWLMSAVYRTGKLQLPRFRREWFAFQLSDLRWRIATGWAHLLGAVIGLAVIGLLAWAGWAVGSGAGGWNAALKALAAIGTSLGAVVGGGLALWGLSRSIRDWLLVRSAAGARVGLQRGQDPLSTITRRFEHVVRSFHRPVAVIVDDLDRCQPEYVVELLEGIQTLFSRAPVAYVIAADKDWIRHSFEDVYRSFLEIPGEPGRPLGHHFVEKTFQLSAEVPRVRAARRTSYFHGLLGLGENGAAPNVAAAGERASTAGTEEELRAAVASARTPEEEAVAVEEALLRAHSAEIREHTEHRLEGFEHLLDPNPRAMKRFVNAYGLARNMQILEAGAGVARGAAAADELALWTILRLRWPVLAEHFERYPADMAKIGKKTAAAHVPAELRPLFAQPDVVDVVRGKEVEARLDEAGIRRILGT